MLSSSSIQTHLDNARSCVKKRKTDDYAIDGGINSEWNAITTPSPLHSFSAWLNSPTQRSFSTMLMKSKVVQSTALLLLLCGSASIRAAEPRKPASVPARTPATRPTIRVVVLKGNYADQPMVAGFDTLSLLTGNMDRSASFPDLIARLDEFSRDASIQHLLFDVSSPTLHLNFAQLAELDRHLAKIRKAGKTTFAWLENAETVHYSVAASCDKIIMTELGALDLPSLSMTTLHFKDAMDLLGFEASVARTGNFKGAVEPFTRSEMSPELRNHYKEMLTTMNDSLVARIARGRNLETNQVRKLQSERLYTAALAKEARLVDVVTAAGAQRDAVASALNADPIWIEAKKTSGKQLSFFELMGKIMGGAQESMSLKPSVAVLHLDGQIIDGENEFPGSIVSGPMVKAINDLRTENNIRAVVVRINSPGGSASASESIRNALVKLSKRKPVIVSMGDVAASGGYWVSAIGRPVYAEAETITGSIGVFALKFSGGPFLKKIGVRVEEVALDESASAMSFERGWNPAEQSRVQSLIDDVYGRFLRLVATSRKLTPDDVSALASGRVWSGAQAVKHKLIDRLGGLDDAIDAAVREAKLDPGYEIVHRPRQKTIFEAFDLFGDSKDEVRLLAPTFRAITAMSGFRFAVPLQLFRDSMQGGAFKAWCFLPTEFLIR